jgi:hypothetical protein
MSDLLRSKVIRLAASFPEDSDERRHLVGALHTAAEPLAPWMKPYGFKDRHGVLSLFVAREIDSKSGMGVAFYLSPGPMHRDGNYEYVIQRRDGVLHLLTDEEIAASRKHMNNTADQIGRGEVVWFVPSGKNYNFGIRINQLDDDRAFVQFVGRPGNATGYNLDLGSKKMDMDDVPKLLQDFGTAAKIRDFLGKFEGKSPSFV